jgi:hypothetical protein
MAIRKDQIRYSILHSLTPEKAFRNRCRSRCRCSILFVTVCDNRGRSKTHDLHGDTGTH